ncbi:hypothetical protein [Aliikangiella coralliicola]|uniref:Uncharacterized protein n=1 Tax=Aliikangiella coralliicola TaxID=2592383 RepID=A0A545UDN0_9GAMM|nr:hypothetical protein [Aliikangiella coralliicola]TQV87568.1 hypothetical protein FLL46_11900 [Aliikangiella coralliicola]
MDEKSYLILVYNKNGGRWKDRTAKICQYKKGEKTTEIKFYGNEKIYSYRNDKVEACTPANIRHPDFNLFKINRLKRDVLMEKVAEST